MKVIFNGHGYPGPVVNSRINWAGEEWVVGQPKEVSNEVAAKLMIRPYFVAEKEVKAAEAEKAAAVKAEGKAVADAAKAAEKLAEEEAKAAEKAEKAAHKAEHKR